MIKYRFTINKTSYPAFFEHDLQAEEFANFINAKWERDTIIIKDKLNGENYLIEMEVGDLNMSTINKLCFKRISVWK